MYPANNPFEATIAKRRSYFETISQLTPLVENIGLYKGLKELKELISSFQELYKNECCGLATLNSIFSTPYTCNLNKNVEFPNLETCDAKIGTVKNCNAIASKFYSRRLCRSKAVSYYVVFILSESLLLPKNLLLHL